MHRQCTVSTHRYLPEAVAWDDKGVGYSDERVLDGLRRDIGSNLCQMDVDLIEGRSKGITWRVRLNHRAWMS